MSAADLFDVLIESTLATSAVIVLVMLVRCLLRRMFGASVAYAVWALVPVSLIAVLLPAASAPMMVVPAIATGTAMAMTTVPQAQAFDFATWACAAWVLGAVLLALHFAGQQQRFLRGLGRQLRGDDGLVQAEAVAGLPAVVGVLRPRIVLPADFRLRYSIEQQALMQAHERTHIARGDLQVNALVALLRCLFWFNPLLHCAARLFRHDQELACDQRVIARHPHARRAYGEAMFKTQLAAQPLPLGCHWLAFHRDRGHPLKERIAMLKQPVPGLSRWLGGSALVAALAVTVGFSAWAAQPAAPTEGRLVDVRMQLKQGDQALGLPRVINHSGEPFSIHSGEGDDAVRAELVATARDDGTIDLAGNIRVGDKPAQKLRSQLHDGRPFTMPFDMDAKDPSRGRLMMVVNASTKPERTVIPMAKADIAQATSPAETIDESRYLNPPKYPAGALEQKIGGMVVLVVDVAADGRPTAIKVDRSEPAGVFDAAVVEAAWKWKFSPAMKDGKPVAGRVRVPVEFSAHGKPAPVGSKQG